MNDLDIKFNDPIYQDFLLSLEPNTIFEKFLLDLLTSRVTINQFKRLGPTRSPNGGCCRSMVLVEADVL